jgi:hypothetical protein
VSPSGGGVTTGDGVYTNGTTATVTANPNAGYDFASWTDDGAVVSTSASYQFTNVLNRSLVANFGAHLWFWPTPSNSLAVAWLTNFNGCVLLENSNLNATNWTTVTNAAAIVGTNWQVNLPTTNATRFYRLMYH